MFTLNYILLNTNYTMVMVIIGIFVTIVANGSKEKEK